MSEFKKYILIFAVVMVIQSEIFRTEVSKRLFESEIPHFNLI